MGIVVNRCIGVNIMNTCGGCKFTDGLCYTSNPPQCKCTITGEFHYYDDTCNVPDDKLVSFYNQVNGKLSIMK